MFLCPDRSRSHPSLSWSSLGHNSNMHRSGRVDYVENMIRPHPVQSTALTTRGGGPPPGSSSPRAKSADSRYRGISLPKDPASSSMSHHHGTTQDICTFSTLGRSCVGIHSGEAHHAESTVCTLVTRLMPILVVTVARRQFPNSEPLIGLKLNAVTHRLLPPHLLAW